MKSRYELKEVVCDYGIFEENKLVLIVNDLELMKI